MRSMLLTCLRAGSPLGVARGRRFHSLSALDPLAALSSLCVGGEAGHLYRLEVGGAPAMGAALTGRTGLFAVGGW